MGIVAPHLRLSQLVLTLHPDNTYNTMYKSCLPLLAVLMTSTGQWLPGYTGHYLYHPRTALDVLNPSVGITYSYPWARNSLPLVGAVYYPTLVPSTVRDVTEEAVEESAVSDRIGRARTFNIFTIGGATIYATLPWLMHSVITHTDSPLAPLFLSMFCLNTVLAITIMGGVFAVLPAYESDLYGPKNVGAIHSRFLLSATLASITGPALLLNLRAAAERDAINNIVQNIRPEDFLSKFAADPTQLDQLVAAKTVTIPRLLEIAPSGTIDPSPFIYNTTLYTMAGLVSLAAMLHFMVKPVNKKYFEMSDKIKK